MSDKPNKKQILLMDGALFHLPGPPDKEPYLVGSKCSICGYVAFPKKEICPICLKRNTMQEIPLSRVGKINTFAISHMGTLHHQAPYVQAYVDLPEGPRVFSMIIDTEPTEEAVKIGMEVELVIDKVSEDEEGNDVIGYKFRLLRNRGALL